MLEELSQPDFCHSPDMSPKVGVEPKALSDLANKARPVLTAFLSTPQGVVRCPGRLGPSRKRRRSYGGLQHLWWAPWGFP